MIGTKWKLRGCGTNPGREVLRMSSRQNVVGEPHPRRADYSITLTFILTLTLALAPTLAVGVAIALTLALTLPI